MDVGLSEVSYTNLGEAETAVQALANCRDFGWGWMDDIYPLGNIEKLVV